MFKFLEVIYIFFFEIYENFYYFFYRICYFIFKIDLSKYFFFLLEYESFLRMEFVVVFFVSFMLSIKIVNSRYVNSCGINEWIV